MQKKKNEEKKVVEEHRMRGKGRPRLQRSVLQVRTQVSVQMALQTRQLLAQLSDQFNRSQSEIVELLIKDYAEKLAKGEITDPVLTVSDKKRIGLKAYLTQDGRQQQTNKFNTERSARVAGAREKELGVRSLRMTEKMYEAEKQTQEQNKQQEADQSDLAQTADGAEH